MDTLSKRDRVALELQVGRAVRSLAANPTPEGKAVLALLRERLVADDDRRRHRAAALSQHGDNPHG